MRLAGWDVDDPTASSVFAGAGTPAERRSVAINAHLQADAQRRVN